MLTRDEPLWPKLSSPVKQTIKSELLACLQHEADRSITKKVCDSVSDIATEIFDDVKVGVMKSMNVQDDSDAVRQLAVDLFHKESQGWPELLPFIFQCVQSGQTNHA